MLGTIPRRHAFNSASASSTPAPRPASDTTEPPRGAARTGRAGQIHPAPVTQQPRQRSHDVRQPPAPIQNFKILHRHTRHLQPERSAPAEAAGIVDTEMLQASIRLHRQNRIHLRAFADLLEIRRRPGTASDHQIASNLIEIERPDPHADDIVAQLPPDASSPTHRVAAALSPGKPFPPNQGVPGLHPLKVCT